MARLSALTVSSKIFYAACALIRLVVGAQCSLLVSSTPQSVHDGDPKILDFDPETSDLDPRGFDLDLSIGDHTKKGSQDVVWRT